MLTVYSLLYTLGMILMSPLFLLRREKYASGFSERLGSYPQFKHDGRKVIWLHCVSVGETNAARPLVDALIEQFPSHRVVVSTTTKTGQELAKKIFADKADAVFYLPFDWNFTVRRALKNFQPALILLMETEIWPRLIVEAKRFGSRVAIVNGRLSEKSFRRYSRVGTFVRRVLQQIDLALMQGENDMRRLHSLGAHKVAITGNIKFDLQSDTADISTAKALDQRLQFVKERYLIIAASTHNSEEEWIAKAVDFANKSLERKARLLIAPRHPERFDEVYKDLTKLGFKVIKRSAPTSADDKEAEIIILDSIGELRAAYALADLVFVGGSLIPHGGQSILEPAAAGKPIVTGSYTFNFADAVRTFSEYKALVILPELHDGKDIVDSLSKTFINLLREPVERDFLGYNALRVMSLNRGATGETVKHLSNFTKERA
jgi:3-deoxy-D-manno-octulosonic-acid transferase